MISFIRGPLYFRFSLASSFSVIVLSVVNMVLLTLVGPLKAGFVQPDFKIFRAPAVAAERPQRQLSALQGEFCLCSEARRCRVEKAF